MRVAADTVFFGGHLATLNRRQFDVHGLADGAFESKDIATSDSDEADVLASVPDSTAGLRRFRLGRLIFSCDRAAVSVAAFDDPGAGIQMPALEFLSAFVQWLEDHPASAEDQASQAGRSMVIQVSIGLSRRAMRHAAGEETVTTSLRSVRALEEGVLCLDHLVEALPASLRSQPFDWPLFTPARRHSIAVTQ